MMDIRFNGGSGVTDEWLTPPEIVKALGEFDLDPCSPIVRPWDTAKHHYSIKHNGLLQPWYGRVFCNPPYGKKAILWMHRMAEHADGILLVFARTDTEAFHRFVWNAATAILFIKGRIQFRNGDGSEHRINAGAPSCLVAYGQDNAEDLEASGIAGKFIWLI